VLIAERIEGGGDFWYYGKPHAGFRQNERLGVAIVKTERKRVFSLP
jgi:hypothetical protein